MNQLGVVAAHALPTSFYNFVALRAFSFEEVGRTRLGHSGRIRPLDVEISKASTPPSAVSEPRVIKFFSHAG